MPPFRGVSNLSTDVGASTSSWYSMKEPVPAALSAPAAVPTSSPSPPAKADVPPAPASPPCLAPSFRVTTFDMPGVSRSKAPHSATTCTSPELLADKITTFMDTLSIRRASFDGCSSAGAACLALVKQHANRAISATVHGFALGLTPAVRSLKALGDEQIVQTCRFVFASVMNEDKGRLGGVWGEVSCEAGSQLRDIRQGVSCSSPKGHMRKSSRHALTQSHRYGRSADWDKCEKRFSKEDITKRPVN